MDALIRHIVEESPPSANPYLAALVEGRFDRDDFIETQIQFFHAVHFFARPMAALAARLPTPAQRVVLLRNVWEEHGEGDPEGSHAASFLELLRRLGGLDPAEVWSRPMWPEVRAFNAVLAGTALLDAPRVGLCTLGMIEHLFADISSAIARGLLDNGWIRPDALLHYDLHAHLDVRHAEDFFSLVRPDLDDAEARYEIEQGLRLGSTAFLGLYEGLWRGRARRWTGRPQERRR